VNTEVKNIENKLEDIYRNCYEKLNKFEIWPGYYERRYNEFLRYYALFPKAQFENTLEIGCGIGYQASFLSCVSNKVTASDVDYGDMIKHSRGLTIARDFISQTGIKNIEIVNANAENLPLADGQFDFVYCSYSFQYIPDKDKALKEISRVLKKDGHFCCILPTTMNRVRAAKNYYSAILKKIPQLLNPWRKKSVLTPVDKSADATKRKHTKLLPPPDDDSNGYLSELFLFSPARWVRLFERNGYQIVANKPSLFDKGKNDTGFLKQLGEKLKSDGIILVAKKNF
jgi:ubiquinone/menaquinone biosynthesis C-methylase UbiE